MWLKENHLTIKRKKKEKRKGSRCKSQVYASPRWDEIMIWPI